MEARFVSTKDICEHKYDEKDAYSAFEVANSHEHAFVEKLYKLAAHQHLVWKSQQMLRLVSLSDCNFDCDYESVQVKAHLSKTNREQTFALCVNGEMGFYADSKRLNDAHHETYVETMTLSDLYACKKHCVYHVCNETRCCSKRVSQDSFALCSLTKKLYTDAAKLSHGWIEDPWQINKSKVTTREKQSTKSVDDVSRHSVVLADFQAVIAVHTDVELLAQSSAYKQFCQTTADELQLQIYERLFGRHYVIIQQISRAAAQQKAWVAVDKHMRKRQKVIVLPELAKVFREAYLASTTNAYIRHLDPDTLYSTMFTVITALVKYTVVLAVNTDLPIRTLHSLPVFVALIYITSHCFKSKTVYLFKENPILQSILPSANQLPLFGFNKTLFTYNKTLLRNAIETAVHNGTPPSVFILRF